MVLLTMRGILYMQTSRKIISRTVKTVIFLIITFFLWVLVRDTLVMKREDGITSMKIFYEQPEDTIDVLFTGSSHACYNIAAEELYEQYGISFYQLWGSSQPFWSTYYFIEEALKTQNPEVIVLDCYGASLRDDYSDKARQATNTLGLKLGMNQIQNIQVSAPKDRWMELFLGLPIYHDRFSELLKGDFEFYPWSRTYVNIKGGEPVYGSNIVVNTTQILPKESIPLTEKQEKWLRKIIQLCKDKKVELLLVVTPTALRKDEQGYYNSVAEIAEETDTPFLNMNELDKETGIRSEDYSYDDSHLNQNGARKTASYLGAYLKDHYELPDHRNDPAYAGWEEYKTNKLHQYLRIIMGASDYFNEIARENYAAVVVKTGDWDGMDPVLLDSLKNVGISNDLCTELGNRIYLISDGEARQIKGEDQTFSLFNGSTITISFSDQKFVIEDQYSYTWHKSGLIVAVYDMKQNIWLDAVLMPSDNSFYIERLNRHENDS